MQPSDGSAARPVQGGRFRRRFGRWQVAAVLVCLIAGLLLGTARSYSQGEDISNRSVDLSAVVQDAQQRVLAADAQAASLQARIDAAADGDVSPRVEAARADVAALEPAAGLVAVVGPGISVSMSDAPRDADGNYPAGVDPDDLVVHQQDVQSVVNALWVGGAEAMMIMDQRVLTTSAVRCIGNTLLLQGRTYSPPFVVTAIGNPARMAAALDVEPGVRLLLQYVNKYNLGYEVSVLDSVELPAYDRPVRLAAAQEGLMSTEAPGRRRTGGDVARTVLRGIGQTLITLGVVVLLFVVYEVYITDLFGQQKQAEATSAIDEVWASAESQATSTVVVQNPDQLVTDPRQRTPSYEAALGEGFAKMYVPAFGADYVFTVIEGTDSDDLYAGPGHYTDTQLPGQQGNFSVAGHRVSKGAPFNDLGLMASCDAVVVETQDDWFVYRVLPMAEETATWADTTRAHCEGVGAQTGAYEGVYGREITVPSDYAQVLPVPHQNSSEVPPDAQRIITLTTCHPQFSDAERMIIHGVLVKSYAKAPGFLPPELGEA